MTTYTTANVTSSSYIEYKVLVSEGINNIVVQCVPTFSVYTGLNLPYANSVVVFTPVFFNIATSAETSAWSTNILQGFAFGTSKYQSTANKTIKVRIYFTDPGLAIDDLLVTGNYNTFLCKCL